MASVCRYGGYTFQDNEVNLVNFHRLAKYSPRNGRMFLEVRATCTGELIYDTTQSISDKVLEVQNALKLDYGDFTYTVGGILAHKMLNSSDCISGVKVISYTFPRGDAAQFANTRHFTFTLQGMYAHADEELVSWTETIEQVGTGGPKFFIVDTMFGPVSLYTCPSSAIYYIQSGRAVGWSVYPIPQGPIFTGLGAEMFDRRRVARTTPRKVGRDFRFYPISWSYHYVQNPNGQTVIPTPV